MNYQQTAETLFYLIPLLEKKFVRPVVQQSKLNLSPTQIRVLSTLRDKNSSTMTTLAKELLMSKQQMTPIVDKLVAENLVHREPDPLDRRIIRIVLAPAGLSVLEKSKAEALATLQEKLSGLKSEDIAALQTTLTDLHAILYKIP